MNHPLASAHAEEVRPHRLEVLQQQYDNEAAGLRVRSLRHTPNVLSLSKDDEAAGLTVRRYIAPSLRAAPQQLSAPDRAGMVRALLVAALLALLFALVTP